jgi:hypothetical protein
LCDHQANITETNIAIGPQINHAQPGSGDIKNSVVKRFKKDDGREYLAAGHDFRHMGIVHDVLSPY